MVDIDVGAALRWASRFRDKTLARRPTELLPRLSHEPDDRIYLLDTCVYIDSFHDRFAPEVERVIDEVAHYHSTCAVQELLFAAGQLKPDDIRTKQNTADIRETIAAITPQRLFHPDADTTVRAGLLAGTLARIQGYGREHRARALNDCTLFLQSQKLGTTLLTRNYADFDILLQMIPSGRVLFY